MVEWHCNEPEVLLVAYIRVATQPGKIELPLAQHINYLAITAALYEYDGAFQMAFHVFAPIVDKGRLVVQKDGRQSYAYRRLGGWLCRE